MSAPFSKLRAVRCGGEKGNGSSVPQYQPFQLGVGKEKQGRFIICWRFSK